MAQSKYLTDSRFYLWRAMVALAHADGVVTPHEVSFINGYLAGKILTPAQKQMIEADFKEPQDVFEMFVNITEPQDKKDFFALARALSWCDGDFASQERHILEVLQNAALAQEDLTLMRDSRDILQEVELNGQQWNCKTARSRNLFEFLDFLKAA